MFESKSANQWMWTVPNHLEEYPVTLYVNPSGVTVCKVISKEVGYPFYSSNAFREIPT